MKYYDTLSEARRAARRIGGTYRKVSGGWLVMDWSTYNDWSKQR